MKLEQLRQKSEIWFAVILIMIYVIGSSIAELISKSIGIEKSITFVFHLLLSYILFIFIKRNKLSEYYGLCKIQLPAKKFLYYIPLVFLASVNLWFGFRVNMPAIDTLCYVGSMLFVGVLEELIFRGFLFNAMRKDNNLKAAIILCSLLFGIGHIVNILNGSGANIIATICQIFYATAIGFLFVVIFYKGKSIIPCIIVHSVVNSLGAFSNEELATQYQIPVSIIMFVIAFAYAIFIMKNNRSDE